jgi:hypothetical protein
MVISSILPDIRLFSVAVSGWLSGKSNLASDRITVVKKPDYPAGRISGASLQNITKKITWHIQLSELTGLGEGLLVLSTTFRTVSQAEHLLQLQRTNTANNKKLQ